MDHSPSGAQAVDYRQRYPWLHLFRAFRIALDVRMLFLGGLALVLLAVGNLLIAQLPFAPAADELGDGGRFPWEQHGELAHRTGLSHLSHPSAKGLDYAANNTRLLLAPAAWMFEPAGVLLGTGRSWSEIAYAWTTLLWGLAVWAVFGGAISRLAAVQFAHEEQLSLMTALDFSFRRFLSYFSAPLLPLAGFGFLWLLCAAGGLVGRIPIAGEWVVGVLWFLPMLAAFLMALVLVGVAFGWPLMLVTISVEGSDAFDGFSRAYSYIYNRPWRYGWYILVTLGYGTLIVAFVRFMAWLIVYLAGWSVAAGMGAGDVNHLLGTAPETFAVAEFNSLGSTSSSTGVVGPALVGVWLHFFALLLVGFLYSFFWTAATIVYFLLRQADDHTGLDAVYRPESDHPDELLPLVGVAASEQPVIERPADDELTTSPQAEVYTGDTEMDIQADHITGDEPPENEPRETE